MSEASASVRYCRIVQTHPNAYAFWSDTRYFKSSLLSFNPIVSLTHSLDNFSCLAVQEFLPLSLNFECLEVFIFSSKEPACWFSGFSRIPCMCHASWSQVVHIEFFLLLSFLAWRVPYLWVVISLLLAAVLHLFEFHLGNFWYYCITSCVPYA